MAMNATVSRTTGLSPYEVFFGEPPVRFLPPATEVPAVDASLGVKDSVEGIKDMTAFLASRLKRAR